MIFGHLFQIVVAFASFAIGSVMILRIRAHDGDRLDPQQSVFRIAVIITCFFIGIMALLSFLSFLRMLIVVVVGCMIAFILAIRTLRNQSEN